MLFLSLSSECQNCNFYVKSIIFSKQTLLSDASGEKSLKLQVDRLEKSINQELEQLSNDFRYFFSLIAYNKLIIL